MSQPLPSKEAKKSNLHKQNTVAALDAGNIIVNPAKLEKLKKIVKVSGRINSSNFLNCKDSRVYLL